MSNHLTLLYPPHIFCAKVNPKVAITVDCAVQRTTRKYSLADLWCTSSEFQIAGFAKKPGLPRQN